MASGTVYRRETTAGGSSWVAHLTWREGAKRRQAKRTYRTKKEAQQALAELIASHRTGTFVAPNRLSLRDYAIGWLAGLETQGRKASTLRGYRQALDLYLLPRLGHMPLQDLRANDFDKLYADLLAGGGQAGRPLSMTSVHHVHAVSNKMLNDAERKGLVTRNVARLADAPSLTTARAKAPEMQVWTPAELATFLRTIEGNRNEVLFRTIALTGIRRSEAAGLRWSDVDLKRGALVIAQAATQIDGVEQIDTPKSRRSRRVIDLDPATAALLQRYRSSQRELLFMLGITMRADDRVFTTETGRPMRPDSITQAFGRLVGETPLPRIRLHDLRHTHASHLLMAGVNVKVVSERLGHASVSFTLDTYAHVMPGQQAEAAAAVAALLGPS